jgi:hypothetical protein
MAFEFFDFPAGDEWRKIVQPHERILKLGRVGVNRLLSGGKMGPGVGCPRALGSRRVHGKSAEKRANRKREGGEFG